MHLLLIDQDFNKRIVRGLARRIPDLDWVPVRDWGYERAADSAVLELALEHGRILLTHDARTMYPLVFHLRAEGVAVPRTIIVPRILGIGVAIEQIELLLRAGNESDWQSPVIRLPL